MFIDQNVMGVNSKRLHLAILEFAQTYGQIYVQLYVCVYTHTHTCTNTYTTVCIQISQMNKLRHRNFQKIYKVRLIVMFHLWFKWGESDAEVQVLNTMIHEPINSSSCGCNTISLIILIFSITWAFLIYYNYK